jgi:uncharacterized membrane protein YeaQ/YmgE (transglycosylase-associated protein family)
MGILIALLIGAIIGWVASVLAGSGGGLLWDIVVGVVGSILGHYLAPMIGIAETSTLAYYAVSVGGAVLLIVILRALGIAR